MLQRRCVVADPAAEIEFWVGAGEGVRVVKNCVVAVVERVCGVVCGCVVVCETRWPGEIRRDAKTMTREEGCDGVVRRRVYG